MDAPSANAPSLTGLRVLIVEDEALLALCLSDSLEEKGCVVVGTAGTVDEALALLANTDFDVTILDLNLCGKPVDEVATAIIERGRAIVFSTGSGPSSVPGEFQGWPVLSKPYLDEAVFVALATAAAARGPEAGSAGG